MTEPVYRRVVVKVSGEALMGPDAFGIHQPTLEGIAADLVAAQALGVAVAVVAGGGNIGMAGWAAKYCVPSDLPVCGDRVTLNCNASGRKRRCVNGKKRSGGFSAARWMRSSSWMMNFRSPA